MQIRQIASNQTQLNLRGAEVLFSYETPVAACLEGGYIRTATKWSPTTSRHINSWLDGVIATEVPQETLDKLVEG